MEILENREEWTNTYRENWLAHLQATGEENWKIYNRPTNTTAPSGPGVDLSQSRLAFVTSAGGYLPGQQEPFDAADVLGDYSIRTFPASTPLDALAFAHDHYDHTFVDQDPQVLLPLRHLEDMVAEGLIGELAPTVVSFMGYQPDVTRVLDELISAIREAVAAQSAQAALLVPA